MALTAWLKQERLKAKHTIRSLAAELGWASSIVGKIELGERRLDVVEFIHYCKALGADPHQGLQILLDLNQDT